MDISKSLQILVRRQPPNTLLPNSIETSKKNTSQMKNTIEDNEGGGDNI